MKKLKNIVLVLSSVGSLCLMSFVRVPLVSAASLVTSISIGPSCVSYIEGASNKSVDVVSGESVNLTVSNQDNVAAQNISGPGVPAGTQAHKNTKESSGTVTVVLGAITTSTTITFTPVPTDYNDIGFVNHCPADASPVSSTLVLRPVVPPAPAAASTSPKTSSKTTAPVATTPPSSTPTTATPTTTTPVAATSPAVKTVPKKKSNLWPLLALGALLLVVVGLTQRRKLGKLLAPKKPTASSKKRAVRKKSKR